MRHLTELLETNNVPSEERKGQYHHLLAQETERLHRMVESLLSFGRMQAGPSAQRLEQTDIAELVEGVVAEFRSGVGLQPGELLWTSVGDLAPIHVDREAVSRALSSLIENADKYSEPGAPIEVAVRRSGDSVEISVSDQGPGIPQKEQRRVFDRFVRGDEARHTGVRGIGVGLALVKSVVEAHGGSVRLVSEPGEGSTFTLRIPCHAS